MEIFVTFYGIIIPISLTNHQKELLDDKKVDVKSMTVFTNLPVKDLSCSSFSISATKIVIIS